MAVVGAELSWWGRALRQSWRRGRGWLIAYVIAWIALGWFRWAALLLLVVGLVWFAIQLLRRLGHGTSLDKLEERHSQRRHVEWVESVWPHLMFQLGCFVSQPNGDKVIPGFTGWRWHRGALDLRMRFPLGMNASSLAGHTEVIADNLGALSARVLSSPSGVALVLSYADPLAKAFSLPISDVVDIDRVRMGLREDGEPWMLRVGPHTLVAGSSGAGKASLVWSFLLGLAPAIRAGFVEVHGVDLKGAMELTMGDALLTRFASSPELAVQLLEDAVIAMQARARELAGVTRQHVASPEQPEVVVLIDELAALTAYLQDRDLLRRANAAIALLCSQGRAVGYTVFACLQDPRKETLPSRGLFTQTIGLRLRDATETAMVLGEGMREKGVLCHRIPVTTPGVAFVVPDDGSDPVRVRAAYVNDIAIRAAAADYPAPRRVPVVVPSLSPESPSAPRRTRSRRRPTTDEGEQQ